MSSITDIVVPEWYMQAKASGISEAELKEQVRAFCQEAMNQRAGTDIAVDDQLVTMTFNMYESAISAGGQ